MDFVTQTFQDLQLPGLLTKEQMQKELDSGKLPKLPPAKKWVVGQWPATPRAKSLDCMVEMVKNCMPEHQCAAKNLFIRCAAIAWSKTQCVDSSLFPRGPKFFFGRNSDGQKRSESMEVRFSILRPQSSESRKHFRWIFSSSKRCQVFPKEFREGKNKQNTVDGGGAANQVGILTWVNSSFEIYPWNFNTRFVYWLILT